MGQGSAGAQAGRCPHADRQGQSCYGACDALDVHGWFLLLLCFCFFPTPAPLWDASGWGTFPRAVIGVRVVALAAQLYGGFTIVLCLYEMPVYAACIVGRRVVDRCCRVAYRASTIARYVDHAADRLASHRLSFSHPRSSPFFSYAGASSRSFSTCGLCRASWPVSVSAQSA